MNNRIRHLTLTALLFCFVSCTSGTFTMTEDILRDKIKGGWAGQTIGCTFGGPTEFRYKGVTIPDSVRIDWPEHCIKWYFDNRPGLYDDVYMDLTFVDVFARKGLDALVEDFALAFANAGYPLWHANLQARENILAGIMPPESGHWKNNPHADDIDFQIEADFAGLMCPGMPNTAAEFCDGIGHIMNGGDGYYGGLFVAAMYSLAFVRNDIGSVVSGALGVLNSESRYYRCIRDVIAWHKENPSDWKYAWQKCQENYGDHDACPSEKDSPFRIDAALNGAYVVIGLLYGEEDFGRTMEIATRCGQDSDCNPATAAGILATMQGYSSIGEKWLANLREVEDRDFAYTEISLNDVYEMSFDQAASVIRREGGKVSDGKVKIKTQTPVQVPLEVNFVESYCLEKE